MSTPQELENFVKRVPDGDTIARDICDTCGFISYENPKIVVGAVVTASNGQILLCKRAIPPRTGYWTLPAGYLETGETAETGAAREAMEEACAEIDIDCVLALYSIARISQVQIIFRAKLSSTSISAGPESQEVGLFDWQAIPWNDIAFPSVGWALSHHRQSRNLTTFSPFSNPDNT